MRIDVRPSAGAVHSAGLLYRELRAALHVRGQPGMPTLDHRGVSLVVGCGDCGASVWVWHPVTGGARHGRWTLHRMRSSYAEPEVEVLGGDEVPVGEVADGVVAAVEIVRAWQSCGVGDRGVGRLSSPCSVVTADGVTLRAESDAQLADRWARHVHGGEWSSLAPHERHAEMVAALTELRRGVSWS